MRTPLGTCLFFLQHVLALLSVMPVDPEVIRYLKLMKSQLYFMQSFVDDLLDLKMLREGTFKLNTAAFDPNKVISLVQRIFQPQADAKNILLHV